jgi:hypothetical protein
MEIIRFAAELPETPNTPPKALTILARDKNENVRYCVERNPNATREVIQTVRAYEFYQQHPTL